jgi:hypothetical protein
MQDTQLTTEIFESRGDTTLRDMLAPVFRHKLLMIAQFFNYSPCVNLSGISELRIHTKRIWQC